MRMNVLLVKKIENIEGFLDYMKNFHKSIVNE